MYVIVLYQKIVKLQLNSIIILKDKCSIFFFFEGNICKSVNQQSLLFLQVPNDVSFDLVKNVLTAMNEKIGTQESITKLFGFFTKS